MYCTSGVLLLKPKIYSCISYQSRCKQIDSLLACVRMHSQWFLSNFSRQIRVLSEAKDLQLRQLSEEVHFMKIQIPSLALTFVTCDHSHVSWAIPRSSNCASCLTRCRTAHAALPASPLWRQRSVHPLPCIPFRASPSVHPLPCIPCIPASPALAFRASPAVPLRSASALTAASGASASALERRPVQGAAGRPPPPTPLVRRQAGMMPF